MSETPDKSPLCLRALDPPAGVKPVFQLRGTTVTVGRHPSNDFVVPVDSVSRYHARIEMQDNRYVVVDLGSSNGTYYEGSRVESAPLELGHRLAFGNVEFSFEIDEPMRDPRGIEERLLKTPIRFVSADQKRSHTILEAEAGRRDSTPFEAFVKAPADRDELGKAYRQLATLYKLSDILRSAPEEQQLLESFMELIFEVLPADRGAILLRATPEGELIARVSRSRQSAAEESPIAISQTIIDRCSEEGIAILSQDALSDRRFKASDSILLHDIRSTIVAPLISHGDILGVLHIDTRESAEAFNNDDLNFITNLADDLALYISHNRVLEESRRNQEMAAIGGIITDLAHSIKNTLVLAEGGIKLMDQLIEEGNLDKVQQNWELTQKALARISTMVKQMLDYTRVPEIKLESDNLNRLIRETCESFKTQFEDKGIAVKLRLDRRVNESMLDRQGLELSLVNLLVNACEAIQRPDGEITVTSVARARDCVVAVEDNGEGIPAEQLPRIFFPRFSTKGEEGTGLGLARVKKWVTAVGGSVHVNSTVGKGTRFVLTLPREASQVATILDE